jgi:hypothetical protein
MSRRANDERNAFDDQIQAGFNPGRDEPGSNDFRHVQNPHDTI